jgi:hypothetical protein
VGQFQLWRGKTRYDCGMGTSDWIAIAALGAGGLMGTLGKRAVRFIGIALVVFGVGGLIYSHFYVNADAQGGGGNCNNYGPNGTINGSCNTIVSPPHDKDSLYQGDEKIGRVQGRFVVDEQQSIAGFAAIMFTAYPDPNKPFEYGNLLLTCDKFPRLKPNENPAPIFADLESPVQCRIIAKK